MRTRSWRLMCRGAAAAVCSALLAGGGAAAAATPVAAGARAVALGGSWGIAHRLPGTAAPNMGGAALIRPLSCDSAETCGARGLYTNHTGTDHTGVVTEAAPTGIDHPGGTD